MKQYIISTSQQKITLIYENICVESSIKIINLNVNYFAVNVQ